MSFLDKNVAFNVKFIEKSKSEQFSSDAEFNRSYCENYQIYSNSNLNNCDEVDNHKLLTENLNQNIDFESNERPHAWKTATHYSNDISPQLETTCGKLVYFCLRNFSLILNSFFFKIIK